MVMTEATATNWRDFVKHVKDCTKLMKADPSLNVNHETALYGMTGMIPDKQFLRKFVCVHQAAMLDTLE